MYYEEQHIPELYYMMHRHDSNKDFVDYEKKILDRSLSPYLYNNDRMNVFLKSLQRLVAIYFDNINIIKNFKNYMVDKYHYMHKS
jgi:hypothetical protein